MADKKLLKKYVVRGLSDITRKNYLEGLPLNYDNKEEREAFSESLSLLGKLLEKEPGAIQEILEIINTDY